MSATLKDDPAPQLDVESIRAYLMANPDFIREDAELFALIAERKAEDGIIDLGATARKKLSTEVRQLNALNEGIVETARANLAVQGQIHMAVLALLEADNLNALDRKFSGRVAGALGVDICRVYIEGHSPIKSAESILGAKEGFTGQILGQHIEHLGPINPAYAEDLYGPQSKRVRSEAIVRLDFNGHDGLLAVATRDPSLFQTGHGTELLNFLARTLERLIVKWMHAS
jgi:uncharacterized protein YigA (DUF484 family)